MSPCGWFSPVFQTLVHDVAFVWRLQVVSPGQQHCRWADRANHQVERLLQVHLPCAHRWGQSEASSLHLQQEVANRKWRLYLCSVSSHRWLGLAGRPPGTLAQHLKQEGESEREVRSGLVSPLIKTNSHRCSCRKYLTICFLVLNL